MPLVIHESPPDFRKPVSQACTQAQFLTPEFEYWCREMREPFGFARKLWEYCYLLQALACNGMIAPGRRGLGFGVGREPTVALLASRGVAIMATDIDAATAQDAWVETGQHAKGTGDLNIRWICPPDLFQRLVEFRVEDMNAVSRDLLDYDFVWSLCALEHLGSIKNGLDFIRSSLRCLRPGGVAIHTTELNCYSDDKTFELSDQVLFRRKDIIGLCEEFIASGHHVELNFSLGEDELDRYVDEEPYHIRRHLKVSQYGFTAASFGLIIRKAG